MNGPETVQTVIPLGPAELAIAALLVLVAGAVSLGLRLGLERRLGIASVRTVVQLLAVGYVLKLVFRLDSPWPVLAIMLVMTFAASLSAVRRASRTLRGVTVMAFITLVASGFAVTFTVTNLVIGVEPWFRPQYTIPLLGMVLGNGLTGISLCLDQVLEALSDRRAQVETDLALGASRWEAAREPLAEGVRKGMIPIINSMMVVGIVSLPGMMTGQILSNSDPLDAVAYQVVVMFMIAAATSLGCMGIAVLVYFRCFNSRHQLEHERITRRR
jgi:putative ABC transport system permease protein